jgi:hypothetical protein
LRNGGILASLRLIALRRCVLQRLIVSEATKIVQALLRHLVLIFGLGKIHFRFVHVFLCDRSLTKQPLAALEDGLSRIHGGFRGLHVELRFLSFLWNVAFAVVSYVASAAWYAASLS